MKRLRSILTVFTLIMIVPGLSNAQVNVNKLKNTVKTNIGTKESKEESPVQKTDPPPATENASTQQQGSKIIFVSNSGSNKNEGSKESPMKNIDKAIEKAGMTSLISRI